MTSKKTSRQESAAPTNHFSDFDLSDKVLKALSDIGYETPTPIQAATMTHVLQGKDILGQAQTGTGKTAAFALPLISNIQLKKKATQAMVLAPTRELAIQVAEAFQKYAAYMQGFHVIPIYGGQDYGIQLKQLRRGAHIVVGTPGRVMDHMRRGTLKVDQLSTLVLDEADEMLRMGFVDDVNWILQQTPEQRQIALFSATMPDDVKRIVDNYLNEPEKIKIQSKTTTNSSIQQRYWPVSGLHKLDALTRILEVENFNAAIIFVRTKTATLELADKLNARGFLAAALNGDVPQKQRERIIDQVKKADIDILVATDVAARGLDVERISHVINYDIPHDAEAYVHRIGRTGRAGREGQAILFVAPREKRLLNGIEKATKQKIALMELPSVKQINDQRVQRFYQQIKQTIQSADIAFYQNLIQDFQATNDVAELDIAAALAKLAHGDQPLLLKEASKSTNQKSHEHKKHFDDAAMQTYRIEVGHVDKVKPGNIMGAITNELSLNNKVVGRIKIYDDYSTVDLAMHLSKAQLTHLNHVTIVGKKLAISAASTNHKPDTSAKVSRKAQTERSSKKPNKPSAKKKPKAHSTSKKRSKTKSNLQKKSSTGSDNGAKKRKPRRKA